MPKELFTADPTFVEQQLVKSENHLKRRGTGGGWNQGVMGVESLREAGEERAGDGNTRYRKQEIQPPQSSPPCHIKLAFNNLKGSDMYVSNCVPSLDILFYFLLLRPIDYTFDCTSSFQVLLKP